MGCHSVQVALGLLCVLAFAEQVALLRILEEGGSLDFLRANRADERVERWLALHTGFASASFVLLLVWLNRAVKNLDRMKRLWQSTLSPGWAVAAFFLPIVSFVAPYIAVQETWRASDPELPLLQHGPRKVLGPRSPLPLVWWLSFLALVVWRFTGFGGGSSVEPEIQDLIHQQRLSLIMMAVAAGSALAAAAWIFGIHRRQRVLIDAWHSMPEEERERGLAVYAVPAAPVGTVPPPSEGLLGIVEAQLLEDLRWYGTDEAGMEVGWRPGVGEGHRATVQGGEIEDYPEVEVHSHDRGLIARGSTDFLDFGSTQPPRVFWSTLEVKGDRFWHTEVTLPRLPKHIWQGLSDEERDFVASGQGANGHWRRERLVKRWRKQRRL